MSRPTLLSPRTKSFCRCQALNSHGRQAGVGELGKSPFTNMRKYPFILCEVRGLVDRIVGTLIHVYMYNLGYRLEFAMLNLQKDEK